MTGNDGRLGLEFRKEHDIVPHRPYSRVGRPLHGTVLGRLNLDWSPVGGIGSVQKAIRVVHCPIALAPTPRNNCVISFISVPRTLARNRAITRTVRTTGSTLLATFSFCFRSGRLVPLPSPLGDRSRFVRIPLDITSGMLLLGTFLRSRVARRRLTEQVNGPGRRVAHLFGLRRTAGVSTIRLTTGTLNGRLSLIVIWLRLAGDYRFWRLV